MLKFPLDGVGYKLPHAIHGGSTQSNMEWIHPLQEGLSNGIIHLPQGIPPGIPPRSSSVMEFPVPVISAMHPIASGYSPLQLQHLECHHCYVDIACCKPLLNLVIVSRCDREIKALLFCDYCCVCFRLFRYVCFLWASLIDSTLPRIYRDFPLL